MVIGTAMAIGGCDADAEEFAPGSRAVPVAFVASDARDPERCEEVLHEADTLVANAMTCEGDLECEAELGTSVTEDPCLPHLVCWLAVTTNERVRLDAVFERLQQLDTEYREACGVCPVPVCADPDLVFATCERSGCSLDVAPPPDDITALASP